MSNEPTAPRPLTMRLKAAWRHAAKFCGESLIMLCVVFYPLSAPILAFPADREDGDSDLPAESRNSTPEAPVRFPQGGRLSREEEREWELLVRRLR